MGWGVTGWGGVGRGAVRCGGVGLGGVGWGGVERGGVRGERLGETRESEREILCAGWLSASCIFWPLLYSCSPTLQRSISSIPW